MIFNRWMKGLATGLVLSLALAAVSARAHLVSAEAPIRQVIRQLVDYYVGDGRLRYNHKIDIDFIAEDEVNAYASYDGQKVSLAVFQKLLEIMSTDEALIVVCHELGHALGDLPHSRFPDDPKHFEGDNPLSLEGEADYFAGKCAVDYYMNIEGLDHVGAQEKTFFAAHAMFEKLYETKVHAQKAATKRFRGGINYDYPDPDCRAFTVWAGAEGKPRPKCWYNP